MNNVNSRQLKGWGTEKSFFRNPERTILLFFFFLLSFAKIPQKTPWFAIKIVNPPVDTTGIDQKRQFIGSNKAGPNELIPDIFVRLVKT